MPIYSIPPGAYDNCYNAGTADAQYDHDNGLAEQRWGYVNYKSRHVT